MTTYNVGPGETYETLAALEAGVALSPDDIVDGGGNLFRETWSPADDGESESPIILRNMTIYGSEALISSSWLNTTGTEYAVAVVSEVKAVVMISAAGAWTKLEKGTAGSLSTNQFDWSGGDLTVDIGGDPNGTYFEVSQRDNGLGLNGRDWIDAIDINVFFCGDNGVTAYTGATNINFTRGMSSYNGGDGYHVTGTSTDIVTQYVRADWNGSVLNDTVNGPGDGISYHDGCTGQVKYCRTTRNYKSGIDNVGAGMAVDIIGNIVSYSPRLIWIGSLADQSQKINYNVMVVDTDTAVDAFGVYLNPVTTTPIECVHNTIIGVGSKTGDSYGIRRIRGDLTLKNNIFYNLGTGQNLQNNAEEDNYDDYNLLSGNDANYLGTWTPGANNITDTDPALIGSTGKVQASSGCVNAGTWDTWNQDGTADPWGKYVHRKPNIGADQGAGAPVRTQRILSVNSGALAGSIL